MNDTQAFSRRIFAFGALSAAIGVALGAFASHGLKQQLPPDMLAIFETGVRYQMYHAFALILTGLAAATFSLNGTGFTIAAWGFGLGTVLFCLSLYLLSIFELRWLGAITPLGGIGFLVGWVALAVTIIRRR